MIVGVGDHDSSFRKAAGRRRAVKCARLRAVLTEFAQVFALRIEYLNSRVARVHHEDHLLANKLRFQRELRPNHVSRVRELACSGALPADAKLNGALISVQFGSLFQSLFVQQLVGGIEQFVRDRRLFIAGAPVQIVEGVVARQIQAACAALSQLSLLMFRLLLVWLQI